MVKCRGAIPFITVAKSKRYRKGVKSIASEPTFTIKSNTFYSLSIPFTFSTVIKGIALSIFNITKEYIPCQIFGKVEKINVKGFISLHHYLLLFTYHIKKYILWPMF